MSYWSQLKKPYRAISFKDRTDFLWEMVVLRDRSQCQYCARFLPPSAITIDHVIPKCAGGFRHPKNWVVACLACNRFKGGKTPEECGMPLIRPVEGIGKIREAFLNVGTDPILWFKSSHKGQKRLMRCLEASEENLQHAIGDSIPVQGQADSSAA